MTVDEIQELTAVIAGFSQSLRNWAKAKGIDIPPPAPRTPQPESIEDNDSEVDVITC